MASASSGSQLASFPKNQCLFLGLKAVGERIGYGFMSNIRPNFQKIFQQAEKKRIKSRFNEAISLYVKAKRLCTKNSETMLDCLFALADCYRMVGGYGNAEKNYKEAYAVAIEMGIQDLASDALVGLGLTLRAMGRHREALKIFAKSQRMYEISKDKAGLAFNLWAKGGAYRIKGDLKKAIEIFKEALKLFTVLKDKSGIGYCYCGLGGASRILGRIDDSYRYYSNANEIFRDLKDTFGIAYSYCGLANATRMKGDFKGSLKYFKKAKLYYKKIGDKVSFAYTLWGEGTAFKMMKNLKDAKDDFWAAQKLFKETKDERGIAYCELSLGELEFLNGRRQNASALFKEALKKARVFSFGVEVKYAEILIHALKTAKDFPFNLP